MRGRDEAAATRSQPPGMPAWMRPAPPEPHALIYTGETRSGKNIQHLRKKKGGTPTPPAPTPPTPQHLPSPVLGQSPRVTFYLSTAWHGLPAPAHHRLAQPDVPGGAAMPARRVLPGITVLGGGTRHIRGGHTHGCEIPLPHPGSPARVRLNGRGERGNEAVA